MVLNIAVAMMVVAAVLFVVVDVVVVVVGWQLVLLESSAASLDSITGFTIGCIYKVWRISLPFCRNWRDRNNNYSHPFSTY